MQGSKNKQAKHRSIAFWRETCLATCCTSFTRILSDAARQAEGCGGQQCCQCLRRHQAKGNRHRCGRQEVQTCTRQELGGTGRTRGHITRVQTMQGPVEGLSKLVPFWKFVCVQYIKLIHCHNQKCVFPCFKMLFWISSFVFIMLPLGCYCVWALPKY